MCKALQAPEMPYIWWPCLVRWHWRACYLPMLAWKRDFHLCIQTWAFHFLFLFIYFYFYIFFSSSSSVNTVCKKWSLCFQASWFQRVSSGEEEASDLSYFSPRSEYWKYSLIWSHPLCCCVLIGSVLANSVSKLMCILAWMLQLAFVPAYLSHMCGWNYCHLTLCHPLSFIKQSYWDTHFSIDFLITRSGILGCNEKYQPYVLALIYFNLIQCEFTEYSGLFISLFSFFC